MIHGRLRGGRRGSAVNPCVLCPVFYDRFISTLSLAARRSHGRGEREGRRGVGEGKEGRKELRGKGIGGLTGGGERYGELLRGKEVTRGMAICACVITARDEGKI